MTMPPARPVVVLDVDGVLADFVGATLQFLERNYGVYADDLKSWDFLDHPALRAYQKVAKGHWATPEFCANLAPLPGTVAAVQQIRVWADIKFATSPMSTNPTWIPERNAWLATYFGAQEGDVLHTHKKSESPGHIFVDDKYDNVVEYQQVHPTALVFLRTQSYNVDTPWKGRRCQGLEDIVFVAEHLAKAFRL